MLTHSIGNQDSLALEKKNLRYAFRLRLEACGKRILGKGGAQILEAIARNGSISTAARRLGMSYKFVWDYLIRMEKILNEPVALTRRGGKKGGGGTVITPIAKALLEEFRSTEGLLNTILSNKQHREVIILKISARNRFRGTVKEIQKGVVTASVKLEVETPVTITAVVTKEALDDLEIKKGDKLDAIVKATEIILAK